MSEEKLQKVANKDELKEGDMLKVEANGKQIVLSMVEGKVYAYQGQTNCFCCRVVLGKL